MPPMWIVWTGDYSAQEVSPQADRIKEEKKKMARRKLTLKDQLKGVKAAIRSSRTPPQLRDSLRRRVGELEKKLRASRPRKTRSRKSGVLDLLGF